jgi:hypothetical protein
MQHSVRREFSQGSPPSNFFIWIERGTTPAQRSAVVSRKNPEDGASVSRGTEIVERSDERSNHRGRSAALAAVSKIPNSKFQT